MPTPPRPTGADADLRPQVENKNHAQEYATYCAAFGSALSGNAVPFVAINVIGGLGRRAVAFALGIEGAKTGLSLRSSAELAAIIDRLTAGPKNGEPKNGEPATPRVGDQVRTCGDVGRVVHVRPGTVVAVEFEDGGRLTVAAEELRPAGKASR